MKNFFRKLWFFVGEYYRFLAWALVKSPRGTRAVASYIVAVGCTLFVLNETTQEIFKDSTDYFIFLVLYPISLIGVILDHQDYFVKKVTWRNE